MGSYSNKCPTPKICGPNIEFEPLYGMPHEKIIVRAEKRVGQGQQKGRRSEKGPTLSTADFTYIHKNKWIGPEAVEKKKIEWASHFP